MLFCPMKTEDRVKTEEGGREGKGQRGKRSESAGARGRPKERCRVLSPWLPGTAGCARSQTYEEAIVREHFAPVTGARQWPPLTRPVTVSLFVDNAWKYAETRRAACGLSLVRRFAVSSLFALSPRADGRKKKRVAFFVVAFGHSEIVLSSEGVLPYPLLATFLRVQRTARRDHRAHSTTIIGLSAILEKRTLPQLS